MNDKIEILLRGNGYVIVNKPKGADSEDKGEGSVPALVRKALGVPYAAPCHRLDKGVGGAMLLSVDEKLTGVLCEQVQNHEIEKEYICVCEGEFPEEERSGVMQDLLFFDRSRAKSFIAKKKRAGVKEASLEYHVIGTAQAPDGKTLSQVKIKLRTGRTHQIRVQFASRKHPLCGDGKYGSRDNRTTVALHCLSLTVNGTVSVCPPEYKYPFDLFSEH